MQFECDKCKSVFEAEGYKKEWVSKIYGPCWHYEAVSPCCGIESTEYKKPSQKKNDAGNDFNMGSCGMGSAGGGCCGCPHAH